jgi:catechol 2,3-dioxygenase-like lactoylglutathione lyase family enzyme
MTVGISHMTFVVQDLEKSTLFFQEIFNAKEIYSSGDNTFSLSREKFFLIGDLWIAIMEGKPLNERTYNHIAFKIEDSEYDNYLKKITALGVEIKPERSRITGEGRSIYFYDFDNHLFELHTGTLEERMNSYIKR